MMWEEALPLIIEWRVCALVIEIVLILGMFFAERDNQNKIIVWMLVFLVAPIFGFIIYVFVGQTFYAEHTFRLKGISDEQIKRALNMEDKLIEMDEKKMDSETFTMVKAIRNIGGASFSNNNDIKLYTEGEDFFNDMLNDISRA
ncbi:MAG: PLDc N-terminal domain-containing protein, partial [Candidatus Methanomethylophilaceae archaeon]